MSESRFIRFVDDGAGNSWAVENKRGGDNLGAIEWYERWHRYVLEGEPSAVFDAECLRDIAAFMDDETRKRKAKA